MILVIVVALVAHILPSPRTIDDAFITFRYSRNIVEGAGFVYNPGEHVLGTTTPLYTVLMAAISAVTGGQDFPWYALSVNALAAAATAALLFMLLYRVTDNLWLGALLGLLWGIAPNSVAFAVGGMETPVNILWLVAATYLFFIRRPVWMGICIGLGFLTRIDALLWIGPLLLYQLGEQWLTHPGEPLLRRIPWRTWLAAALVAAPWILFSWAYFGSFIPNSIAAKTAVYHMEPGSALTALIRVFIVPFSEYQLLGSIGVMVTLVVYILFLIVGYLYIVRHCPRLLPFVLFPWLYLLVFSIANPLVFRWYTAPPMPALMLTILMGAWTIVETLRVSTGRRWITTVGMAILGLFWVSTSLGGWQLHPTHGSQRPAPEMAWHQQELYYKEMADELVTRFAVTPQTRIAASDIGVIGYFTNSTIIDTVGLIMPGVSAYYPVDSSLVLADQNYAIPPRLIEDTNPQYLVTMEAAVRLGLEEDPVFSQRYELVREIPTDFYGTGMRLYRARG